MIMIIISILWELATPLVETCWCAEPTNDPYSEIKTDSNKNYIKIDKGILMSRILRRGDRRWRSDVQVTPPPSAKVKINSVKIKSACGSEVATLRKHNQTPTLRPLHIP